MIKTFWGRVRGMHGDRRIEVVEGLIWRCKECEFVFLTKANAEAHECGQLINRPRKEK
jgi:ribosomal protein L37AE/L43A